MYFLTLWSDYDQIAKEMRDLFSNMWPYHTKKHVHTSAGASRNAFKQLNAPVLNNLHRESQPTLNRDSQSTTPSSASPISGIHTLENAFSLSSRATRLSISSSHATRSSTSQLEPQSINLFPNQTSDGPLPDECQFSLSSRNRGSK